MVRSALIGKRFNEPFSEVVTTDGYEVRFLISYMNFEEIYKEKKAVISDCGKYRYELHRQWDKDKDKVLFIMLNPSTADSHEDDLTTIRCVNFAKKWGSGGIMIGNIYPFRAKRPKDLRKWLKTPNNGLWENRGSNISHVQAMASKADRIICAWGCNYKDGVPDWIDELDSPVYCLELCKDGVTPKHPLGNLSKDLIPKELQTKYDWSWII